MYYFLDVLGSQVFDSFLKIISGSGKSQRVPTFTLSSVGQLVKVLLEMPCLIQCCIILLPLNWLVVKFSIGLACLLQPGRLYLGALFKSGCRINWGVEKCIH